MKKQFLIIIPLIILGLSACGSKPAPAPNLEPKVDVIELASSLLNEYSHQVIDFSSQFDLSGNLPIGLNIMPIVDEENKLELYGIAKEKGEFFFTLTDLNTNSKSYKLKIIEATYHQNSWQELISADCLNFYDGCNNCSREEIGSKDLTCTEMYCEIYSQAICLD